jgi:hypothetical protein
MTIDCGRRLLSSGVKTQSTQPSTFYGSSSDMRTMHGSVAISGCSSVVVLKQATEPFPVGSINSVELKMPPFTRFPACQILPSQPVDFIRQPWRLVDFRRYPSGEAVMERTVQDATSDHHNEFSGSTASLGSLAANQRLDFGVSTNSASRLRK